MICLSCGKEFDWLPDFLHHAGSHISSSGSFLPLTAIEKEALIAIEDRVKHSPDYQHYYVA